MLSLCACFRSEAVGFLACSRCKFGEKSEQIYTCIHHFLAKNCADELPTVWVKTRCVTRKPRALVQASLWQNHLVQKIRGIFYKLTRKHKRRGDKKSDSANHACKTTRPVNYSRDVRMLLSGTMAEMQG